MTGGSLPSAALMTLWPLGEPWKAEGGALVECGPGVIGLKPLMHPTGAWSWFAFVRDASGRQVGSAYCEASFGAVGELLDGWMHVEGQMRQPMRAMSTLRVGAL